MCKIAILEKYALFSSGIKSLLAEADGFDVVAESEDVKSLSQKMGPLVPDVIILDVLHCNHAGIRCLERAHLHFPHTPILLITNEENRDCFPDYLSLGVKGIIFNNDGKADLIKSVKNLSAGEKYFRRDLRRALRENIGVDAAVHYLQRKKHILTERELSVLRLFCTGLTFKEIGHKLFISPRTVETHKKNIMAKMNVNSTAAMIKYATHHKIG